QLMRRSDAILASKLPFGFTNIHDGVRKRRSKTFGEAKETSAGSGDPIGNSPSVGRENHGDSRRAGCETAEDTGFGRMGGDEVGLNPPESARELADGRDVIHGMDRAAQTGDGQARDVVTAKLGDGFVGTTRRSFRRRSSD